MTDHEDEFLFAFIEESLEHLQTIESGLLSLERRDSGMDTEQISLLFRAAHSIKGGAGFVGLEKIQNLAHKMENLIGLFRDRDIEPDDTMIDALLKAADTIGNLLKKNSENDSVDISENIETLEALYGEYRKEKANEPAESLPSQMVQISFPDVSRSLAIPVSDISKAGRENRVVYWIEVYSEGSGEEKEKTSDELQVKSREPAAAARAKSEMALFSRSREEVKKVWQRYGSVLAMETITRRKAQAQDRADGGFVEGWAVLFASVLKAEDVFLLLDPAVDRLFILSKDLKLQPFHLESVSPANTGEKVILDSEKSARQPALPPANSHNREESADQVEPSSGTGPSTLSQKAPHLSLRVKVELLDSIMALAGELVLTRNQLLEAHASKEIEIAEIIGQRLDSVTTKLQEAIMQTRMQPIGIVFNMFPRMVRDFAAQMEKNISLSIEGRTVEVDKTLIEALKDPIAHLVRNALDHGIESPRERITAGKRKTGRIFLKAFHEAGQVNIEVGDDGRGMDGDRLASLAVKKRLLSQSAASMMSQDEKLGLIMLPGFSTLENVTEVSGRGVGMDVVKKNLERLGGQIAIYSKPGKGTTIRIKIPLTLAIISCQMVETEGERFAIPRMNLAKLVRVPPGQVKERVEVVGKAPVLRSGNKLLPLVRLAEVLEISRTYIDPGDNRRKPDRRKRLADRRSFMYSPLDMEPQHRERAFPARGDRTEKRRSEDRRFRAASALNIAVVIAGALRYGLVVDRLLDPEEIVVKPLGSQLKSCECFSGATIMGNGRVALILDIGNLARTARLNSVDASARAAELARHKPREKDINLIVSFHGTEDQHFALPLAHVVRVEKVSQSQMERVGGKKVLHMEERTVPLFSLDQAVGAKASDNGEKPYAVFLNISSYQIALLVNGPVEIVEFEGTIDYKTFKDRSIMGSLTVRGKTILLLDGFELGYSLAPNRFSEPDEIRQKANKAFTVLFAEDSRFFRSRVREYMEQADYRVIAVEDGLAAWSILEEQFEDISLVVTDIAMPNMDGFELTEKIREHDKYRHLPVIALTTLGTDADIARGMEAGVNDYQIKLDREKLLRSIGKLLKASGERKEEEVAR